MLDALIVEDEPVVAEAAARILGMANLDVRKVATAPSALEELRRDAFKIVLCDLKLPGDSGFRVLEAARALRPEAQVIMITGYATCENVLESFRLDAFDFLAKPFDVDELLATVSRALRLVDRETEASGTGQAPRATDLATPATDGQALYLLGRHAWARLDPDGSATLGLGPTFGGLLGTPLAVELPADNEHLVQCRQCAVIRGADGLAHRVWAPLSGRVIAVHRELASEPSRIDREPWNACWLFRIVPEAAAEELSRLAHS